MTDDASHSLARTTHRGTVVRLGFLFGTIYFVQGIGEPGSGLMNQPVQSLLKLRGLDADAIGFFSAWLGMPWSFKPLYGLLSDFLPLWGSRRRHWLVVTMATTMAGFTLLALAPSLCETYAALLLCLTVTNLGIAFSDVVVDALMIETAQPLGATGRLQSIQWACLMAAGALAGVSGGWISQHQRTTLGFTVCAGFSAFSLLLCLAVVRDPGGEIPRQDLGSVLRALGRTLRSRTILASAGFLFLWSFNPFSADVLYLHLTQHLQFDEQTYGTLKTVEAAAGIAASVAYAVYCTRVRFVALLHASILLGVLSTAAYVGLSGIRSAYLISAAVGFITMTATMIQLDLAARVCPPQVAGTVFAVLMSVSNFALDLSKWMGGAAYGAWSARWGAGAAFEMLVVVGSSSTAACWLLMPLLKNASRTELPTPE